MTKIMKIAYFLQGSGLLTKGVCETIENKAKKQQVDFLTYYQVYYVLVIMKCVDR